MKNIGLVYGNRMCFLDGGSVVGKLLFEAINTYCQGK